MRTVKGDKCAFGPTLAVLPDTAAAEVVDATLMLEPLQYQRTPPHIVLAVVLVRFQPLQPS
jgi:hypothetical protein